MVGLMDADYRAVAVNLHDRGDSSGPRGAPMILPVARGIRHKGLRCLCDCRSSRAPPGHLTLATDMRVRGPYTLIAPYPYRYRQPYPVLDTLLEITPNAGLRG